MIELQQVTKIYDGRIRAVDEISFSVRKGEIFGLIGTSGCGKTTTLKVINRLVEPTSGRILVDGKPADEMPADQLRRNIGYVIQDVGLFPHYSIGENIAVVPRLLEWDRSRIDRRCRELLELVGLDPDEYAGRAPAALSGGQQQRVGFARALAADPEVILMDEPFGALDPITKEQIQNEFKKLLQEINKTIVLVTHDVSEAFELCDRVALMDGGRIQQTGTPKELLMNPANAFVASFFDVHRLELEMQTVTVGNIIKVLGKDSAEIASMSPLEGGKGDDLIVIETTTPFSDAYSRVRNSKNDPFAVSGDGEIIAYITAEELLSGFHQIKKSSGGGHG